MWAGALRHHKGGCESADRAAGSRVGPVQHQGKCHWAPGWIRTEMVEKPLKSGILDEEAILSVSPVGRFGKTEEIASLACFLACKDSDYIVGQVIFADGGWSLGIMPHALDYIRENEED